MKRFLKFLLAIFVFGVLIEAVVYWRKPELFLEAEYFRLSWTAGVKEHAIEAAGHRWHYYDGGDGPPVVLVHGFSGSKENWLALAAELSKQHRVVIPDLAGWGESQRHEGKDYTVRAQAERLGAFLDALSLPSVDLVGHSMGGHIAGLYAARNPGRIRTLTLVSTAGVRFEPNAFARRVLAGETPFNFSTREEFDAFMRELFVEPPWLPPRLKDVLIGQTRARHDFQAKLLAEMGRDEEAFRLEGELGAISVPTLVLWCDGDRILDVSSVETIRARMPRAKDVVLAGCGHMPMMERPAEMADAMRPHLAR